MFKKSEKKVKAVFKLQFQATQVPQLKAKSLMISLVPVDVGKPTVRLPKVPILEGICTWESPIYETVKLIKETKTGKIREKFYYVVVSTGSSKSGFLGEVSIDFADLADATKPSEIKLPLLASKSGAILNMTVQRMQADSDRHGEDNKASIGESYDSEDLSELASPHNDRNRSIEDVESDSNGNDSRDVCMSGKSAIQMKMLERKAELSELEAESLRKQILKETKKGEQLIEQIAYLKEEKEWLILSAIGQNEDSILRSSLQDVKQVLQREKQLNKKLKLQVQKTEDSNSEYVLAVRDLNKKLEQKNTEISLLSNKLKAFYSEGKSPEELANKWANVDEKNRLKQKTEDLHSELEVLKKEKAGVLMDLQKLNLDCKSLEIESKEIYFELEQSQKEKTEIQHSYAESLATLKQFKLRVASLEEETKRQSCQYSESLNMIDELELEVERLNNEIEKQVQVFEEDLEYENKGKDEMERRAIKAEGALRKTKRKNAGTAERIEEEFRQLSADLYLKIDENDKLALEAATDLRQKNSELEELLNTANDILQIKKESYEKILQKYTEQCNGSSGAKKNTQKENEELERQLVSVRKEVEKLMQENTSIKSQMEQKKSKEGNMHLEVRKLRLKNNEVKNQLHDLELENGELEKEITKLQGDLRKKNQGSERFVAQNNAQQKNGNPDGGCDISSLLSEVALLKERNKNMESELNEMHEKYSEVSLKFAEVEGERQQLALAVRNLKGGRKT